jgi:YD repeat-containing protein
MSVNVANGNLMISAKDVKVSADYELDSEVTRTYNSRSDGHGAAGRRWTFGVGQDVRLDVQANGTVVLWGPTDYLARFKPLANNAYAGPAELGASLAKNADGTYTLSFHESEEAYTFSSTGRFTARADLDGNRITYGYDTSGKLTSITDNVGEVASVQYSNGLVSAITPPGGTARTYSQSAGNLTGYTGPSGTDTYSYDANGNLWKFMRGGVEYRFTYDADRRVTSITRVTNPQNGTGDTTTYTYNAGNTRVTNPSGRATTYNFNNSLQATATTGGGTPPSLTVTGSLLSAAGTTLTQQGVYGLNVSASDSSGVTDIQISANGDEEDSKTQSCPQGGCSMSFSWNFQTEIYAPGRYEIEVKATDASGDERSQTFNVTAPAWTALPIDPNNPPPVEPPAPTQTERIQEATRFRTDFGLDASPLQVLLLDSDPGAQSAKEEWGVPLTTAERARMREIDLVQTAVDEIEQYGRNEAPTSYAGVYTDYVQGGLVYVGFKTNASTHMATLQSRFDYPDKLRSFVVPPTRTLAELESLRALISDDINTLEGQGVGDIVTVSQSEERNRIEVGMPSPTPTAQATLTTRYGPGVLVVQATAGEDASRFATHQHLDAGLAIYHDSISDGRHYCTNAFNVKRFRGGKWKYYTMTAGHCGPDGSAWEQGDRGIGSMAIKDYADGGNMDAAFIRIPKSRTSNRVRLNVEKRRVVPTHEPWDNEHPGKPYCSSAAFTNRLTCGKLVSRGYTQHYSNGATTRNLRRASYECRNGDSGGPIFRKSYGKEGVVGAGIHHGWAVIEGTRYCTYSHVRYALAKYDAELRR